jgi:HEAT repeat protein
MTFWHGFLSAQQTEPVEIVDSLVEVLVKERRNWNEASGMLIEIGEPAINPLIKVMTNQSLPEWPRRKAAYTLRDIPSQRIVPTCIRIFQDTLEPGHLRIAACRSLRGKDVSQYLDVFKEAFRDENPFIRLAAMPHILAQGGNQAWKISLQAIRDEHNLIRRSGYEYVAGSSHDSIDLVLCEGLFDKDWYVREFIFEQLKTQGRSVAGYIEKILRNPAYDESVRWSAISILRQIQSYGDIDLFVDMLYDPNWMIRNEAVLALIERFEFFEWNDLTGEFESQEPDIQYSILLLIGRIGSEASIPWILEKLNDPVNGWMSAIALGLSHANESIEPLTEGLKDPDTKKRQACLWALIQIKPENLIEIVTPYLRNEDPEMIRLAISALKMLETPEAKALLRSLQ